MTRLRLGCVSGHTDLRNEPECGVGDTVIRALAGSAARGQTLTVLAGQAVAAAVDSDIRALLERARQAISATVRQERIGVAFSGGVDSSLVAKLCHDMGYDTTLLTVGFAGSYDIDSAREVNGSYGYPHEILEITHDSFREVLPEIVGRIRTDNLSWIENSVAFYYISRLARGVGIDAVVTANGIDELFCGYDAYRDAFAGGRQRIMELMDQRLENELRMFEAVGSVASEFGVSIVQPLLSPGFVEFAKTVPVEQKIVGGDDLVRKHVIRRLASQCGVPQAACERRKKALQYGSKIHRALMRSRRIS